MNQSENNPVIDQAQLILDTKEGFRGARHIFHYTVVKDAMETYANLRTAYLIQTIENRVKELENSEEFTGLSVRLNECNNLLTLIKS